jgi:SAM-dependent methyltransferase
MSNDLMFQNEIRDIVRTAYGAITTGAGLAMAHRFYSDEELADVPAAAVDWALGVGNPVRHAGLADGEVVLDVGSGGGIDTVLAAQRVGPAGRVIGLDALPEMCERARAASRSAGVAQWCDFQEGEMEAIPLPDESVDVVISNGVINLSPRKSRAFAEITRVLRPGGRICVSDLVVNDDLPPDVLSSGPAWAGCIAGALSERLFCRKLDRAGLVDVAHAPRPPRRHAPAHRHERDRPSAQARSTHPGGRRRQPLHVDPGAAPGRGRGSRVRRSHGTTVDERGRDRAQGPGDRARS